MSDRLDEHLRGLGQNDPFPVDWAAYEREVTLRLARVQRTWQRRTRHAAMIGVLSGAAAAAAVAMGLMWLGSGKTATGYANTPAPAEKIAPSPLQPAPVITAEERQVTYWVGRNGGHIRYTEDATTAHKRDLTPFVRTVRNPDGSTGTIRFYGVSE